MKWNYHGIILAMVNVQSAVVLELLAAIRFSFEYNSLLLLFRRINEGMTEVGRCTELLCMCYCFIGCSGKNCSGMP
jgi:hypothetical protein